MNNLQRISMYRTLVKLQDIQIKQLKKELSIYRDKYKNLREKIHRENRKNRNSY